MIFLDSNIPMYLIGQPHPHKDRARHLLERFALDGERLVTDVEVFQEILHRYAAIRRPEAIDPAFALLRSLADETFAIEPVHVEAARALVVHEGWGARDALHLAVMRRHNVPRILTFDRGFDRADVERLY